MPNKKAGRLILIVAAILLLALVLTACELSEPAKGNQYFINENVNSGNQRPRDKDAAIDNVTDGITNLRKYLDSEVISDTGYYMGMEFNVDTEDPVTLDGGNFKLKIQAHLFTYKYEDDDGNPIIKYKDPNDGRYYDTQNEEGTREEILAEDIHNDIIRKSDILIEWYDGASNEMLIGLYFDGKNNDPTDPGNVLYLNIQGAKRSFADFGDTVLYRQLIRLLMNLSVEKLLTAGNLQGDAGVSSIESLFDIAVTDNYQVVLNAPVTSTLFYGIAADALATNITEFIQGIFAPFEDKIDPLTLKYLGFRFSEVGRAVINSIASDMQFFTEPDPTSATSEILSGAYLTFTGATVSGGTVYNYVSDVSFEYGAYPPEGIKLDRDFYVPYEYGKYEFTGNLYIPMLNSNFDALIRTDIQQYRNEDNNVFMQFRDIANGEVMIGAYYRNERTYIDISGMEYLYGWVDLNEIGFPKVYDESLNLSEALADMFKFINDGIVSIVDSILSPDQNDKENHLLEYIMEKTSKTEKIPGDIFSKNTVTLTVDMVLIKHVLEETGNGTYTTRQIIDILDSMLPYSMDQIAIMLGVANAEVMLDNSYFTFTLNVDTNEITIKLFTNVGVEENEDSTLIFQLDLQPRVIGQQVNIADVNFAGFKPLEQIYTYSATMNGNFVFSAAETVDLSKLLSATIGENSGLNTPYKLASNAGITFRLIYDQFVTDHEVEGVMRKQGRSAFELNVWLTGAESSVLLRLASDDVAFNNDVYQNQPERAAELGYVWVSIECVSDNGVQRIPKVKIREDVFMSSMQAYLDGTSISDDAANLGNTDVNLSITSILFALMEDSYVVMEPEQLEITSSNETLQNLFRVRGLIGNIRANAGFRHRVEGLQSIKNDYGMYQVGQFTDMRGNSPYDTVLHDEIPVYFYDDYSEIYPFTDYDLRVDYNTGVIQVYRKGGRVSIFREAISYATDSFFNNEDANNQDVSRVRFRLDTLPFVYLNGDRYCYTTYEGEEVRIENDYVRADGDTVYIYYLGIKDRVHHLEGAEYCYYAPESAVTDENGDYVYISPRSERAMLFEYDENSVEVTEAAKTQYAPRINGSFMGTVRRYILTITTPSQVERGKIISLNNPSYYSEEDENNKVEIYDDNGVLIREEAAPIVLFVMEPCEPLSEETAVNMQVNTTYDALTLPARFEIDWDSVTLKGGMWLTNVVIAPGTMGEKTFPVRIIVTNREIIAIDSTTVYTETTDFMTQNVPVVDSVDIDPYDYILAKNNFFTDVTNYGNNPGHPEQWAMANVESNFKMLERRFINQFFSKFSFRIRFDYTESNLYKEEVKSEYIAESYVNTDNNELYDWNFDMYEYGNNLESKISALASGNATSTALYLHTYYKGQLIALRINVGQRILSHIKFGDDDTFDPQVVNDGVRNENGDLNYGDDRYIYGHYVANYFDEESYTLPANPIFVFTDGAGHYYEKVFDMEYVSGIAENGNYLIQNYGLAWGNPKITYIGVNGSYYMENGEMVNRPFDISNVEYDENGTIIVENEPTKLYDTDITTASVNWIDIFAIFKRGYGKDGKIRLIAGDSTNSGFLTSVLRITVECPKLDVANATTENGQEITEADDLDSDDNGNSVVFTPSAVQIGNNSVGYYLIDPLDADTLEIPTEATLYFKSADGKSLSSHRFKNIEWRAQFEEGTDAEGNRYYFGDGSFENNSGVTVVEKRNGKFYFVPSTENTLTTKIMAKIGSSVSGYQYITLCINVLSKDPQEVEFYYGTMPNGSKIEVERTNISLNGSGAGGKEFAFYTYYVDTFRGFRMPNYVTAYFGLNKERSESYYVEWERTDGGNVVFAPNTVLNLKTEIGTGEVVIEIYLSVVVANYSIEEITLTGGLESYYVQVGGTDNYVQIGELLETDFERLIMGLYATDGRVENYIRISMGEAADNGVEAGKIGLYVNNGGGYVLSSDMYPYDFVREVYGRMNIRFASGAPVDLVNIEDYYANFVSASQGYTLPAQRLGDIAKFEYFYSAANRSDNATVSFRTESGGINDYYPAVTDGFIEIYPNSNMNPSQVVRVTLEELTIAYTYLMLNEDIDGKVVTAMVTAENTIDLTSSPYTLKNMYTSLNGNITFNLPTTGEENVSFIRLELADGTALGYEELVYRLKYRSVHRNSGYTVPSITNKQTEIQNLEGIFDVNDVVQSSYGFAEKNYYKIMLGTGEGAYDMTVRLHFVGGYRLTDDSAATEDISILPYSGLGYAQYGAAGYVLGNEISAEARAVRQNGGGVTEYFQYGPAYANAPLLEKWYVEDSTFADLPAGTFITAIPQSIIYSTMNGDITVSTLTEQGFRLRRKLVFDGVPEEIRSFHSNNTSGLLIRERLDGSGSAVTIDDIYDYLPLNAYFAGTSYLPTSISFTIGGQDITVNNVNWAINPDWYGKTTVSNGQVIGTGILDRMTYEGTINKDTGEDNVQPFATAEILGWEDTEDGQRVFRDRIKINLNICIKTAEAVSLPWDTGRLNLDTTPVVENGSKVFLVDVDAFNDMNSSAIDNDSFVLPSNISVKYKSGGTHTFRNVEYMSANMRVTEIPYGIEGINTALLADMLGRNEDTLHKDHIDLTVSLGLSQTLTLRFRFYDKRAESVTPIIEKTDEEARQSVLSAMSEERTERINEILNRLNQTRIRRNVEKLFEQANLIRDGVEIATAEDFVRYGSSLSLSDIEELLIGGWTALSLKDTTDDVEKIAKKQTYDDESLWNFALGRMESVAKAEVGAYALAIYRILNNDGMSDLLKTANIRNQLANFVAQTYNGGYDAAIGDYIKIELTRLLTAETTGMASRDFGYAIRYKNYVEASFDYSYVIREIYRIREFIDFGMLNPATDLDEINAAFAKIFNDALSSAMTAAKRSVSCIDEVYDTVDNIILMRLGLADASGSVFEPVAEDVNYFVQNYAQSATKTELRKILRTLIIEAMNFETFANGSAAKVGEVGETKTLMEYVIADNINGIQNFSLTVSSIRRNLVSSVDISSMINTILNRGVTNYVDGLYMESKIAGAIDRAQRLNIDGEGYYYIDPYYDYRIVPNKILVNFAENGGGFGYVYDAQWTDDNVSENVNYRGNAKNDLYGYVYTFYDFLSDENYENNAIIKTLLKNAQDGIAGLSWEDVKRDNRANYNTIILLETLVRTFYDDTDASNEEERILTLYTYYVAGNAFVNMDKEELIDSGIDVNRLVRDYDKYRYDELNAPLYNANTGEGQTASLIVKVNSRALNDADLNILDENGLTRREFTIDNPFEATIDSLPHKIRVGGEELDIIWNDIQISPLGNLGNASHTIHGNIKHAAGQEVTLELYVARWEYMGVYSQDADGNVILMNPLNFYFSNSLTYSAEDSYEVRFNVYEMVNGRETLTEYKRVQFYPQDSRLLVNSEDDMEMDNVTARRKYVMYWDEMARANVLNNRLNYVNGDLYVGNEGIGQYNISSLSINMDNANIPKTAYYSYDGISVDKLGLTELDGETVFGVGGEVTFVTDVFGTLPTTGEVILNQNNITYDTAQMEVRLLWNNTYSAAVSRLINFVAQQYPEVEPAARQQFAVSLIMDMERSETEQKELMDKAREYIVYMNTGTGRELTDVEITREAEQLLMINERYDYKGNVSAFKGGSTGNKTVTVLIRYGESSYIYETVMRVRLVFADSTPIKYLSIAGRAEIADTTVEGAKNNHTSLYIAVRTDYWDEVGNRNAYAAENVISPYDVDERSYRLLEQLYSIPDGANDYTTAEGVRLRLIRVENIVYEDKATDGRLRSKSFEIDGIRYESNLISLPVRSGGNG